MQFITLIKRDLILCLSFTVFVVVCALAWGSPFIGNSAPSGAALVQSHAQRAAAFRGTLLRDGEQFLLRDSSGQVFRLDNPQKAQPFEGKAVTITGELDRDSHTIHVERIESAMV